MQEKLVALSVDLDALDLYQGLYASSGALSDRAREAIPARAAERFCDLCAALGIHGTLFVVGRDVAAGQGVAELRAAAQAGHEIGNHSFGHDYALSRKPVSDIEADLSRADSAIADATGQKPRGFRAPGYTLSPALKEAIVRRGYAYDSSLLPSPPYYAVKATVIGALKLLGRESHSILGPVGQLFDGRNPSVDSSGLVELPVSVLPGLRVPYYGTLIGGVPSWITAPLGRTLVNDRLVVIELHGVEFCDASDGVPPELLNRQRDLRIPAPLKLHRIRAAMKRLLNTRRGVTLAEAAQLVAGARA